MKRARLKGFTIIESMLFLGVTGLIMTVMLTGVSVSLNRERYKDAVNSFTDYMQGQYNLVANVNNSRNPDEICTGGSIVVGGVTDAGRGTSDCTIVGRVIHMNTDGTAATSAQVYATVDAATLPLNPGDSDEKVLQDANLIASPTKDEYTLPWSTRLVEPAPNSATPNVFSMLIVRMPTTGLLHTYAVSAVNQSPAAIIGGSIPSDGLPLCVDPSGLLTGGVGRVGVIVAPDAANSAGVKFLSEGTC